MRAPTRESSFKLVTSNIQFDSGVLINTQLQLGVGKSAPGPNRFNGFTVCGRELLKQFRDPLLPNHPSEEGC
jgi:hypothetical protein